MACRTSTVRIGDEALVSGLHRGQWAVGAIQQPAQQAGYKAAADFFTFAMRVTTHCREASIQGAMTKQPYPEEFKIEAVKQITERGHRVADVSTRIGVSQHSLYKWIKAYAVPAPERQMQTSQTEELRRLKAELKRVTEERDILKKAAAYFARQSG